MTKEEIIEIKKYFIKYSDTPYSSVYINGSHPCTWYYHCEEEFHLIIFDSGEVYQSGTEADIIGIELETLDDLKIRFKSFTGEEVDNVSPERLALKLEMENEE